VVFATIWIMDGIRGYEKFLGTTGAGVVSGALGGSQRQLSGIVGHRRGLMD